MQSRFLSRIINKIKYAIAMRSSDSYINYLRKKGVYVGLNTHIHQKTCQIDLTRPSLITIGDNVLINKKFSNINGLDCFLYSMILKIIILSIIVKNNIKKLIINHFII